MSNTSQQDRGDGKKRRGRVERLIAKIPQEIEGLKKLPGYWQSDARELDFTIVEPKPGVSTGQKPTILISINEFSRMVEGVELSWEEPHTATKKAKHQKRTRQGGSKRPTQFYTDNGHDFNTSSLDKPMDG